MAVVGERLRRRERGKITPRDDHWLRQLADPPNAHQSGYATLRELKNRKDGTG